MLTHLIETHSVSSDEHSSPICGGLPLRHSKMYLFKSFGSFPLTALLLYCLAVHGVLWPGAEPTSAGSTVGGYVGVSPQPTSHPQGILESSLAMEKRQNVDICGYANGDPSQ